MIRLCAFADEAGSSLQAQIDALHRNGIGLLEIRTVDSVNIGDMTLERAEEVAAILKENNLKAESEEGRKAACDLVKADIDMFKKGGEHAGMFPERWLPSCFAVLPEAFTEQNGMMNSTMKVVRGKVEKFYKERIDILYTAEGKQLYEQHNLDAFK